MRMLPFVEHGNSLPCWQFDHFIQPTSSTATFPTQTDSQPENSKGHSPIKAQAIFLALMCLLFCQVAVAQRCYIIPSVPVAVPAGGSYGFTADCGTGLIWTLSGAGNLDSSGFYAAPQSVRAQNQDRGCQVSPNNSPFNVPVDNLPVDSHSSLWLTRALEDHPEYLGTYHAMKFYPQIVTFYSNPVSNSTQLQTMHFYYSNLSYGYQDAPFPLPPTRSLMMETGVNVDPSMAYDRHLITMNKDTCTQTEIYNLYVDFRTVSFTPGNPTTVSWTTNTVWNFPQSYTAYITGATGGWHGANNTWTLTKTGNNTGTLPFDSSQWGPAPSGIIMSSLPNGCNNCNSQGGQQFSPTSYQQFGGVDAAGMPIGALSAKPEEWYAATQAGRSDLGHALRTTISNNYLSARYIWPATSYALEVAGSYIQLTGATNTDPVVFTTGSDLSQGLPCDNYSYTRGCQFHVNISGIVSGLWIGANGDWTATAIDDNHYSIQLDGTGLGSFPGAKSVFDFFPYGATLRLKSSVDVDSLCTSDDLSNWCPYAKVYLNTLKKYGMVIADGTIPSDNWDNGAVSSEFHPDVLTDASTHLRGWTPLQPLENSLEVVDRSSQQNYSDLGRYQDSKVNEVTVTVCGSNGCASDDVLLQGTTIGTDHERLLVAAGLSYQLNVWTHGNSNPALSYSIDSGIQGASVSNSGLLTMPNCATKQKGMVMVTSQADSDALPLYIQVECLPVSSDGSYRLAVGNYSGDYVDVSGNTWWGSWANNGFYNYDQIPGLAWGAQAGTWQGAGACSNDTWTGTDSQLYSRSTSFSGDTKVELAIPNGSYNVTLYGEPGFGGYQQNNTCGNTIGKDVFDWVVQGSTIGSLYDGYVLAGYQPYNGYQLTTTTNVTDNVLDVISRMRAFSTYGISVSSFLITPTSAQQLVITTNSLPHGFFNIPYLARLSANYGNPPYSWSLASGSGPLPQGLQILPSGIIFGRPSAFGQFPITIQVTDSQHNTGTKDFTLTVCSPGHLC